MLLGNLEHAACPSKWAREVLLLGHAINVGWHKKEGKGVFVFYPLNFRFITSKRILSFRSIK
jgi:hypothetical protein